MIDRTDAAGRKNSAPRWAVKDGVTLCTWPDESDAIVYLPSTGDMHWLSREARGVIEALQSASCLTDQQIYQWINQNLECDKDDVAEHYLPYLSSLGLINRIS